jgi:hypothetical protein
VIWQGLTLNGEKEKFMARIDHSNMKQESGNGTSNIHDIVPATYRFFVNGKEKYFQIDTYGSPTREKPDQPSQKIQFDKETSEKIVKLLKEGFGI